VKIRVGAFPGNTSTLASFANIAISGAFIRVRLGFIGHVASENWHIIRIYKLHSFPFGKHNRKVARERFLAILSNPSVNNGIVFSVSPYNEIGMFPGILNHAVKIIDIDYFPGNMPTEVLVNPTARHCPINPAEIFVTIRKQYGGITTPGGYNRCSIL
jgi:hypothetical protein